jgi:hypothetical protein
MERQKNIMNLSLPSVRKQSNSMELYHHSRICLHGMLLIKQQGQIYLLPLLGRRGAGISCNHWIEVRTGLEGGTGRGQEGKEGVLVVITMTGR